MRQVFAPHRPRLSHRHHRPARRRQEHAGRSPDRRARADGQDRRRRRGRSDQPVHRRRDPRRSRPHAVARRRRRRLHPQHGDARQSRRPGARDHRRRAASSTPPARTSSSSRPSASARTKSTSSAPPTSRSSTLVPGTGDEVQALKAGIMEIADIFVVNKADREGADRTVASIEALLSLQTRTRTGAGVRRSSRPRRPPARACRSWSTAIERFRAHTAATLGERRRARAELRVRELLAQRFVQHVARARARGRASSSDLLDRIAARETDPYTAVDEIIDAGRLAGPEGPAHGAASQSATLDHIGIAVAELERGAGVLPRRARARGRGAGGGRVAARARALHSGRGVGDRAARSDRRRLADREVRGEARARAAPHHAARRRHPRRARAAEGARRPPDRRAAARQGRTGRWSPSSIPPARTACWSS